jgi:hypothetical protein
MVVELLMGQLAMVLLLSSLLYEILTGLFLGGLGVYTLIFPVVVYDKGTVRILVYRAGIRASFSILWACK